MNRTGTPRRVRLAGLGIAIAAMLFAPRDALAHGHLKRSRPAAGATLREVPRLLRLEFTERPELAVSSLRLLDAQGVAVALAPVRAAPDSDRVLLADITGALAAGRYTVLWQIAGADGHPVTGKFTFTIATDAAGLEGRADTAAADTARAGSTSTPRTPAPRVAAATLRAPGFDALSPWYVAVRWAQFTALLVLIGAMAFHYLVLGVVRRRETHRALIPHADRRAITLATWAAALLAASAIARLAAQLHAVRAAGTGAAAVGLDALVFGTAWGRAWMLEAGALLLLAAALPLARRARMAMAGWALAAAAAVVLASVPGQSGHAAVPGTTLAVAIDTLHVLGAGGWMGGLLLVLAAGLPAAGAVGPERRGAAMAALVNAFSPTALGFASLVAVSGALAAWRNLGGAGALVETGYGRVLLVKLAALAVAAAIGAWNWRRARPALDATGDDAPIRLAMRAELAAGLAVLLVTAILVAVPMPAG